ncbi:tRNA pseudouridine synthase Pus10 [Oryza brachyantha]|uniref:tRNA pseudouridine(55) synthase n=1 Tax=Oryza brachyantha TaxID=4533 RepID=J3M0E0_ORYBR|nr:tRNA pseudouridine synthase Pus10 [Oryza brachyantha]
MTATGAAAEADAEARSILESAAAASFPPLHAVHHLLSVGVCVRCIFRLFGAFSSAIPCLSLTASVLHSFLEEHEDSTKNGSCSCLSTDVACCSICFGVLLPTCYQDDGTEPLHSVTPIDNVTSMISQTVLKEGHQIDEFSLEISLPAVIAANDRATRLYIKEKYGNADWFNEKIFSQTMSVKEALRMLLVPSLEKQMNVKHVSNSFRIRLTYTHEEASQKLLKLLPNDRGRKRKAESRDGKSTKRDSTDDDKHILSESDSFINKTLEGIEDQEFCSLLQLPPEKVLKPCHLVISCQRSPIYIGGRYLKLSRNVSQSCWIIDDERMGEASVEEIIGENVCAICKGDGYKFHAAGREDIDVRMLGSGRPFLVEVLNVRSIPSATEVQQIADKINNSEKKHVRVINLKLVGSEIWTMMREGEAEKQKQYAALIWTSRPLTDDDLHNISLVKDMEIVQKTPIRVLHRRSPLERKRIIHWMEIEKIAGRSNYYLLHLCTQAGTYIKEFVHGDLGRTHPSFGVMLSCRAEILQLDVTDVKMDFLQ